MVVGHYKVILETERLLLREMDDDGVQRWIDWCKDCYQKYGFGLWAVILKETGEMIGDCGVSMQLIDDEKKPEIGYHLRYDHHQKGLGKEMTQVVKDYFFTHFDFDEVYSYTDSGNLPSYKTAEANGMTFRHLYTTKQGEVCRVYSVIRKEWENANS